jgi:hypothetical protein
MIFRLKIIDNSMIAPSLEALMDQVVQRGLQFDRFELDLARGCLRSGDQEISLRPKTFEVPGRSARAQWVGDFRHARQRLGMGRGLHAHQG